jgi:hypothetical protein
VARILTTPAARAFTLSRDGSPKGDTHLLRKLLAPWTLEQQPFRGSTKYDNTPLNHTPVKQLRAQASDCRAFLNTDELSGADGPARLVEPQTLDGPGGIRRGSRLGDADEFRPHG